MLTSWNWAIWCQGCKNSIAPRGVDKIGTNELNGCIDMFDINKFVESITIPELH